MEESASVSDPDSAMRRVRRSRSYGDLLIALRLLAVAWAVLVPAIVWTFASPEFPLMAFVVTVLGCVVHLFGVVFLLRAIKGDSELRGAWNAPGILPGILIVAVIRDAYSPSWGRKAK